MFALVVSRIFASVASTELPRNPIISIYIPMENPDNYRTIV